MAPIFEDFRENETLLKFSHLQRPESGPVLLDFEDKENDKSRPKRVSTNFGQGQSYNPDAG